MLSGKRQAIDSVLIKANASMDSLLEKELLNDVAIYSKELEDNEEKDATVSLVPNKDSNKKGRSNKTHYSPSDPDSRISTKPGKLCQLNYLGQVAVDTGSHIITHVQAFYADKKDSQCLKEVVAKTQINLNENDLELEEIITDGGYSSSEALQALQEMNLTGYIPNFGGYISTRIGFTYDKEGDRYICPQGKYLPFKRYKATHGINKEYRSSIKDCNNCPIKNECIGKYKNKTISDSISKSMFDQMEIRMNSKRGLRMRKLRQSTVEPVIGTLVNYMGLKRVNTKGISNATKCMTMSAIAYNLKKLLKSLSTNEIAVRKAKEVLKPKLFMLHIKQYELS